MKYMKYLVAILAVGCLPLGRCSNTWERKEIRSVDSIIAGNDIITITQTKSAQSMPPSGCETGAKAAEATPTLSVFVGTSGDLRFDPTSVTGNIGDIVHFDFLAKNHTLTQSSLSDPCRNEGGVSTGFNQFNPSNETGRFLFQYRIKTLDPEWFFCAQSFPKSHCQAGMLFAINPNIRMEEFHSAAEFQKTREQALPKPTSVKRNHNYNTTVNKSEPNASISGFPTALANPSQNTTYNIPETTVSPPAFSMAAKYRWEGFTIALTCLAIFWSFY